MPWKQAWTQSVRFWRSHLAPRVRSLADSNSSLVNEHNDVAIEGWLGDLFEKETYEKVRIIALLGTGSH